MKKIVVTVFNLFCGLAFDVVFSFLILRTWLETPVTLYVPVFAAGLLANVISILGYIFKDESFFQDMIVWMLMLSMIFLAVLEITGVN